MLSFVVVVLGAAVVIRRRWLSAVCRCSLLDAVVRCTLSLLIVCWLLVVVVCWLSCVG